jgi:hypothetical protein
MANGLPIDLETFRKLQSQDAKLDALFDVLVFMHSAGYECEEDREARLSTCEKRFAALETRKKFDTGLAGGTGLIGGAIVWFIKWFADK